MTASARDSWQDERKRKEVDRAARKSQRLSVVERDNRRGGLGMRTCPNRNLNPLNTRYYINLNVTW